MNFNTILKTLTGVSALSATLVDGGLRGTSYVEKVGYENNMVGTLYTPDLASVACVDAHYESGTFNPYSLAYGDSQWIEIEATGGYCHTDYTVEYGCDDKGKDCVGQYDGGMTITADNSGVPRGVKVSTWGDLVANVVYNSAEYLYDVQAMAAPTSKPSAAPTVRPSAAPSKVPTQAPTAVPTTANPTGQPTGQPTQPTGQPSGQPSGVPTGRPTSGPTSPTGQPTGAPTKEAEPAATDDFGPESENATITIATVVSVVGAAALGFFGYKYRETLAEKGAAVYNGLCNRGDGSSILDGLITDNERHSSAGTSMTGWDSSN